MPPRPRSGSALRVFCGALLTAATMGATAAPAYAEPGRTAEPVGPATAPGYAEPAQAEPVALRAHDQLAPLRAEQAWQYSTGDGVIVAVLDSGVDAGHPDLAGRVLAGQDYVDGSTDGRADSVGHGTTVASLIAANSDDTVIGLAPDATILPVRVLDDDNRYQSASTVAEGVVWAVQQGAQVINLSLGGDRPSAALGEALSYAMAHDVVVVACTGNMTDDQDAQVWYPAREPGVVGVAGLAWAGDGTPRGWSQSLTGPETVLAAPAVVTGAQAGGGYRAVQGTSFSSALVAATAALVRARWPDLPAADVVNRLVATAADLGEPGRDPVFGFGALDPVAALTEAVPPVPTNPLDTKARHGAAGFGPAPDRPPPAAATQPADPTPTTGPTQEAVAAELVPGQPAGRAAHEPAAPVPYRPPVILVGALLGILAVLLVAAAAVALRSRRT